MKKNTLLYLLSTAIIIFGAASPATAADLSPELEAALLSSGASEEISVIVTLADQVDLQSFKGDSRAGQRRALVQALKSKADQSQKPLVATLRQLGVKGLEKFWIFNGVAFRATPEQIYRVAAYPGVNEVRLDGTLNVPETATTATSDPEWNLVAVNAPDLWNAGFTGSGIVIADMDTGVDVEHPDLSGNWRGGDNSWYDPNGEHSTPYDSDGHGTQSMSLIVGGEAGGTSIGMAPGAEWIAVKIFNDTGEAAYSSIHLGFQWLLDPDNNPATNDSPDIVNNSWGLRTGVNQCITEFQADVQALTAADIAVVFAAGNEGPSPSTSISPANYPDSFAVGAVDSNLEIVSSSSRGPATCDGSTYPQVVAPGLNVRVADLTFGGLFPNSYTTVSGTSFSAPHVSGSMALLRSAFPGLTVDEMNQALEETAFDLGQFGADNDYGNGLIDLAAAYNQLLNPSGCSDADADGFFAEPDCGTEIDCNDLDATVNPAACDIKRDGIDQDCDGSDRTKGKSCPVPDDGSGGDTGDITGGKEGNGKTCTDGLDNDGDGLTDCADPDCSKNRQCR